MMKLLLILIGVLFISIVSAEVAHVVIRSDMDSLDDLSCSNTEIAKWNSTNSLWECQEDSAFNSSYLTSESDPIWSSNFTQMLNDCSDGNYSYGIFSNGTWKCRNDIDTDTFNSTQEMIVAINNTEGWHLNFTTAFVGTINLSNVTEGPHTVDTTIPDTNETTRFNALTTNCTGTNKVRGILDSGVIVCDADVDTFNTTAEILAVETNETTRFNTLTTNCTGTNKMVGVLDDGSIVCDSDIDTNISKWNITTSKYIINNSGILDVNETVINNTIDSKAPSLNVNQSKNWINYNATNITWFENVAGELRIILSQLTSFINSWFSGKTTDDLTEGTTNKYDNQSFNQTLTGNLYADISVADTNESTRFNTLTTNCTGTDKMRGVLDDGSPVCDTDVDTDTHNTSVEMIAAINTSNYYQIQVNYSNVLNHPSSTVSKYNITWVNQSSGSHTGAIINGTLTGYEAAHNICKLEFGGWMCNEFEVDDFQRNHNTSLTLSGVSWTITGAPKYAPADHPVSDCSGFTVESTGATDPLGNFWNFDVKYGIAGNCGISLPITCCK